MRSMLPVLLALGSSLLSQMAFAQTAETLQFQSLPHAVIQHLNGQDAAGLDGNASDASLAATSGTWNGNGNLGNITQTNYQFTEYFPPPNTVPLNALMTSIQWGWQARNPTAYPLTVYLCFGSTSQCLNTSSQTVGQQSLVGYGIAARTQVFYVMYASSSATVVFPTPIYAYQESVYISFSY